MTKDGQQCVQSFMGQKSVTEFPVMGRWSNWAPAVDFTCGSEGLCCVWHHFFPPDKRHSVPCLFARQIPLLQRDTLRYTRCIFYKEQWQCQTASLWDSFLIPEGTTVAPPLLRSWCPQVITEQNTHKKKKNLRNWKINTKFVTLILELNGKKVLIEV